MSSKFLLLLPAAILTSCSANRIEISPQPLFSSETEARVRDCPLAAIDSLAPCRINTPVVKMPGVHVSGDTLTFAVSAPGANEVRITGGIELPLDRVGDSDIFAASIRVPKIHRAVIGYRIFTDSTKGSPPRFEFRGDSTGCRPLRARQLRGSLRFDTLFAQPLGERRELISYLPAVKPANGRYDVVYVPDGGLVKQLAPLLDTLIAMHRLRPIALVGVRASQQFRANEYVWGFKNDSARFAAHEKFFVEHVINWAEKTLSVSNQRVGRMIWGASNGGAFAVAMGLRHPNLFSHVFAASPVFELLPIAVRSPLPVFHIAAGTFEGTSRDRAIGLAAVLGDQGARSFLDEFTGGHDEVQWLEWVVRVLLEEQS